MARIKNLFAACCAVVVLALSGQGAWPQSGRTIHLIVPVPPGASTDAVARLMAEQIGRAQGVTIVVENRPGASRNDRDRGGFARGAGRQHAADDGQHLSDRRPDPEGELPSGDRLRSDLLPGAIAGGVRGQQRVAL